MLSVHVIIAVVAYFVFSAAVGAMSQPTEAQRTKFYGWFFRFANILAANATRLVASRFPGAVPPDSGADSSASSLAVSTHTEDTTFVAKSS